MTNETIIKLIMQGYERACKFYQVRFTKADLMVPNSYYNAIRTAMPYVSKILIGKRDYFEIVSTIPLSSPFNKEVVYIIKQIAIPILNKIAKDGKE